MGRLALAAVALVCALSATDGAWAQAGRRASSAPRSGSADEDTLPPSVPPPVSTLSPTRGIAGPKLEPGAVLCRSEDDLQHRTQVTARRINGDADPGNPMEGCHMINQERGVEIVGRHGLGRTEVKVKPTGETGWTDAYMP